MARKTTSSDGVEKYSITLNSNDELDKAVMRALDEAPNRKRNDLVRSLMFIGRFNQNHKISKQLSYPNDEEKRLVIQIYLYKDIKEDQDLIEDLKNFSRGRRTALIRDMLHIGASLSENDDRRWVQRLSAKDPEAAPVIQETSPLVEPTNLASKTSDRPFFAEKMYDNGEAKKQDEPVHVAPPATTRLDFDLTDVEPIPATTQGVRRVNLERNKLKSFME